MKTRTFPILFTTFALALGAMALLATPAFAADPIEARIPFGFTAGTASLGAGSYTMSVDWNDRVLMITETGSGRKSAVPFVTTLSGEAHAKAPDARLVFDRAGDGSRVLSEVWLPEGEGVLVGMTKGKHEHDVIGVKR